MSKATFLEIAFPAQLGGIMDALIVNGFVLERGNQRLQELQGIHFLDITQRLDDTGNGLADARFGLTKQKIDRQTVRKARDGWSPTKISRWHAQKEGSEIQPMLHGAAKWLVCIEHLLKDLRLPHVGLLVAINRQDCPLQFSETINLRFKELDESTLVQLSLDTYYSIRF